MKNECLFTPEQKQVVIGSISEFGKFFADKNWKKAWTHSISYEFRRNFIKNAVNQPSAQLGVLFAYYIAVQNYDYFKKNRQCNYQKYFTNTPATSWSAFAYYIWQSLQKLQSDDEVQVFFDELCYKIISK